MSALTFVDPDLVTRICRDAIAGQRSGFLGADVEPVGDRLDGTSWVGMDSWSHAREALTALNAHGISGHDCQDGRLHVTGWDLRLLHWRLGALLAGVDDLTHEWGSTVEMVWYHYDRRVSAGVDPIQPRSSPTLRLPSATAYRSRDGRRRSRPSTACSS